MIFYFSGTGNSQWVAREIARMVGDGAVDIVGLAADCVPDLSSEEIVGFAFPVYAWGVPEPVAEFAARIAAARPPFAFGVCTYGEEAGYAMRDFSTLVPLDSAYGIAMPSNYIIAADRESPEVIRAKLEAARAEVARIAEEVSGRRRVDRVNVGPHPFLKSKLVNKGFSRYGRATKPFRTTDACDGCGLCARRCPAGVIELHDGAPRWTSPSCYQCLRCINECPTEAIQYGKGTEGRGRYTLARFLEG